MEEKVLKLLEEIRPEFDFSTSSNFVEDGFLDSFDIVTMIDSIEREFDIIVGGLEVIPENFETVSSICNLICNNGGK